MTTLTPERLNILCRRLVGAVTRIKEQRQDWHAASNIAIRWAKWAARQNHR